MGQSSVVHNTFVIERRYPAAPGRVFAAFADPVSKRRWFVEGEHNEIEHFEMDFRVGGWERARFRFKPGVPVAGMVCTNDTTYLDIVPHRRIVFASAMALAANCISASLVTIELLPFDAGTNLICTHQGAFFEGADGPEMRQEGWRKLLGKLTAEL
jgi:uncharacterized protein YndB with AHSA1/START domain